VTARERSEKFCRIGEIPVPTVQSGWEKIIWAPYHNGAVASEQAFIVVPAAYPEENGVFLWPMNGFMQ